MIDGAMSADREAHLLSPLLFSLIPGRGSFHTQYHSTHDFIPFSDAGYHCSAGCRSTRITVRDSL
jgi:hypothetical protein